jgi:hypothetical protein
MKYLARVIMLLPAALVFNASPVMADASLTLVGGNTIYGSQLAINNFGVAGTIQGLAAGTYSFALVRTPHLFTTVNLQLGVGGFYWSNFGSPHFMYIGNTPTSFSISGIIPNAECGEYEAVKLGIYNTAGQLVISNNLTIMNPTHPAPVVNFKINGSSAVSPNAITINNASNITLTYTGSGTVTSYRLYAVKASADGSYSVGPYSDTSWHTGPVPTTVNIRALGGGSFVPNQMIVHPGYYAVKLETEGTWCAYVGSAPRIALIRTENSLVTPGPTYFEKK